MQKMTEGYYEEEKTGAYDVEVCVKLVVYRQMIETGCTQLDCGDILVEASSCTGSCIFGTE